MQPRAGEAIEAKILDICHDPISHRSVDGSPSSDKENSSTKQSLITDLFPTGMLTFVALKQLT